MIRPREYELRTLRNMSIFERLPVGKCLAGMIDGRLEVDQWFVDDRGHRFESGLGEIVLQIFAFGEGANPECIGIGGEHRQAFTYVFRSAAVHDGTGARFELPRTLTRCDDERRAAESHHPHLERRQRTQRRIEEHQSQNLASERLRLRVLLEVLCQ